MPLDTRPKFGSAFSSTPAAAAPIPDVQRQRAERLTEIERALTSAPARIRCSPVRRALWRALLLPVGELSRRRRLAPLPPQPGEPGCLDALAEVLVSRAIMGNARAALLVFDLIEGRPRRRREVQPSSGLDPVEIERIVKLFQERAAPNPAGTVHPPLAG